MGSMQRQFCGEYRPSSDGEKDWSSFSRSGIWHDGSQHSFKTLCLLFQIAHIDRNRYQLRPTRLVVCTLWVWISATMPSGCEPHEVRMRWLTVFKLHTWLTRVRRVTLDFSKLTCIARSGNAFGFPLLRVQLRIDGETDGRARHHRILVVASCVSGSHNRDVRRWKARCCCSTERGICR